MIHHLLDVAASPLVVIGLLLIAGLYFATPVTDRLYRAAEFLTPTSLDLSDDTLARRAELRAKAAGVRR